MIHKCNIYDLEKTTGIVPRDNWHTKARKGQVYFVNKCGKITAFLYLKDAKKFLRELSKCKK